MLRRLPVLLVAVAVVALAAGLAAGLLLSRSLLASSTPQEGSADAGFARDMSVHHAQAVEMSVLVRDRSSDEDVRQLAIDIALTQQHQQGQMFGWLQAWGLPAAGQGSMEWMSDGHAGMGTSTTMPGLATPEQLAALTAAEGVEAERVFLALMIPHHQGGVEMAEAALDRVSSPEARRLAQAVVDSQTAEITVLETMLAERGGPPTDL